MAYPDHLLSRGERVVLHKHPHWKLLILPILAFIVIIGGAAAFIAWVTHWDDSGFTTHLPWIIGAIVVGVLLLVWLVLAPILRWATEHFVISTGHVFFRTGILKRREHQIPLARIQNMETEVTFWGRILGFGSLIIESAADQPLAFDNVAAVSKVQSTLNQLISDDRGLYPQSTAGDGSAGRWHNQDTAQNTRVQPRDQDYPDQGNPDPGYPDQRYDQGETEVIDPRDGRR